MSFCSLLAVDSTNDRDIVTISCDAYNAREALDIHRRFSHDMMFAADRTTSSYHRGQVSDAMVRRGAKRVSDLRHLDPPRIAPGGQQFTGLAERMLNGLVAGDLIHQIRACLLSPP